MALPYRDDLMLYSVPLLNYFLKIATELHDSRLQLLTMVSLILEVTLCLLDLVSASTQLLLERVDLATVS